MVKTMNDLLQLKGRLNHRKYNGKPGPSILPEGKSVTSSHLQKLRDDLQRILLFWEKNQLLRGALVSVHYNRVVPKSNRIKEVLVEKGLNTSDSIRGSKFKTEQAKDGKTIQKHVFTHFISLDAIRKTITNINMCIEIVNQHYKGKISHEDTRMISKNSHPLFSNMSKTKFLNIIFDAYNVEKFDIDTFSEKIVDNMIVTIFKTGRDTKQLLSDIGINIMDNRIINETTLMLTPDEMTLLNNKAGYLISMGQTDFSKITISDMEISEHDELIIEDYSIPSPTIEPIVGVIDTLFDESVYFNEWVESKNLLNPNIEVTPQDYYHGTAISSIIVDGPKGNPDLEDGCGRFRVRHFGVSTHNGFSSFTILKLIHQVVAENRDIKVWNLCLGSELEINKNYISPEAAELDRIQNQYDVIFIVAGTNIPSTGKRIKMSIGSPADSINAVVVNSVTKDNRVASYTRTGPVLSFFHKPDVSYYGGDGVSNDEKIAVCIGKNQFVYEKGTSFAAPWITRKIAYLIYQMGMTREVAKALIVDAASGWNPKDDISNSIGYGIVPKHIQDVIRCNNDEIRFVISGIAEEFETYAYNIPIPQQEQKHPFFARATLVYFPKCDRNQGVDYTSTELDLHFGRIKTKDGKTSIVSINNNRQSDSEKYVLYEGDARKMYRKWDNVKRVTDELNERARPRKSYDAGMWGISVKSKERLDSKNRKPLPFGLVVTLKEMNGVNRNDEFIKLCMSRGWLVNSVDIHNQLDIYNLSEEEIDFE